MAKTAARFYHSKFETISPWLRYHFERFLAYWLDEVDDYMSCGLDHISGLTSRSLFDQRSRTARCSALET